MKLAILTRGGSLTILAGVLAALLLGGGSFFEWNQHLPKSKKFHSCQAQAACKWGEWSPIAFALQE